MWTKVEVSGHREIAEDVREDGASWLMDYPHGGCCPVESGVTCWLSM